MTRTLLAASLTLLLGAAAIVPTVAGAAEGPMELGTKAKARETVRADVPLPVARPDWRTRLAITDGTAPSGDAVGSDRVHVADNTEPASPAARVAPAPDGSSLKTGSSEALSVQLEGAEVVTGDGQVVGEVEKVIEQPDRKPQAIVGLGGFLGFGEHRVLIPADYLVPSGKGIVRTKLTAAQLRDLPIYEKQ